jgi:hypothetical protein
LSDSKCDHSGSACVAGRRLRAARAGHVLGPKWGHHAELKSGNKATFTFAGDSANCTYNVGGAKIELTCQGEKTEFTIHDDGSLTGPPGNLMGVLRKTKS